MCLDKKIITELGNKINHYVYLYFTLKPLKMVQCKVSVALKYSILRKKKLKIPLHNFFPLFCYLPHPFSSLLQQILWFDCLFLGKGDNDQARWHPFWKVKRRIVSRA